MNKIRILMVIIITLLFTSARAADFDFDKKSEKKDEPAKVLLDPENMNFSGYWGIYSRYSKISGSDGYLMGGRAALIVNNNFAIGLGGMSLIYPTDMEMLCGKSYTGSFDTARFYYGGLLLEYYFNPKSLIVFSAGTLIGGGDLHLSGNVKTVNEKCLTIEPEINIFINLTHSCRIGIGSSYRYVSGIKTDEFESSDFSGFTASAMIQVGAF